MNRVSYICICCNVSLLQRVPVRIYSKRVASRLRVVILLLYLALEDDVLSDLKPDGSVQSGAPVYKRDVGILE